MRVAIVSDVHGNLTAFDAVLADIERRAPDLVLHGGDLALMGAQPGEVIDRVIELGWPTLWATPTRFSGEAMSKHARKNLLPSWECS
jgi:3',5'-cyclic AMP phosphodiesterase CpdA